jgi:hypothetical protein
MREMALRLLHCSRTGLQFDLLAWRKISVFSNCLIVTTDWQTFSTLSIEKKFLMCFGGGDGAHDIWQKCSVLAVEEKRAISGEKKKRFTSWRRSTKLIKCFWPPPPRLVPIGNLIITPPYWHGMRVAKVTQCSLYSTCLGSGDHNICLYNPCSRI